MDEGFWFRVEGLGLLLSPSKSSASSTVNPTVLRTRRGGVRGMVYSTADQDRCPPRRKSRVGTSQRKSGTSVNLSNSGNLASAASVTAVRLCSVRRAALATGCCTVGGVNLRRKSI